MSDRLILKSINELLGEHFYIPHYQRGYRWTEHQVNDLLNDIWTFTTESKKKEHEFYCLQPIVVKAKEWIEKGETLSGWEVVDGQQRLTTMFIIISYLEKEFLKVDSLVEDYGKEMYSLRYETRPQSEDFLKNIREDKSNIDFYHINAAYITVRTWFTNGANTKDRTDKNKFLGTLLGKKEDELSVQVIWYMAELDVNSIDLFTRLNIGKIPLTNSELIKALLLSASSFQDETHDDALRMKMEISQVWDQMEQRLNDEDFWSFVTNEHQSNYATKIELLFEMIANKEKGEIDPLFTFLHFLSESKNNSKKLGTIWLSIEQYFLTLCEWYVDKNLYHKVGYLITVGSKLRELIHSSMSKSKLEFERDLDKRISASIDFRNRKIEIHEIDFQNHYKIASRLLLLFNVESIRTNKHVSEFYPFKSHKKSFWSLEHIHAQNSESLDKTKKEQWTTWISYHTTLIKELVENGKTELKELLEEINRIDLEKLTWDKFQVLSQDIIKAFSEDPEDRSGNLHSLSNLALLSQPDNAALNNSVFEVKRREIIKMDKEGNYIPLCTRRVFLKYYNDKPSSLQYYFWSKDDQENYLSEMKKVLKLYLATTTEIDN